MLIIGAWLLYFIKIAIFVRWNHAKNGFAWSDVIAIGIMVFPFLFNLWGIFSGPLASIVSAIGCLFIWHNIRWFDNARNVETAVYISIIFIILLSASK
ncbi:MAG: hypothetical protein AAB795_03440 [Patescibacteria group bacterium]